MDTKINTVILIVAYACNVALLMLGIGTAGLTTTVLAQMYNHFTAKLSGSNEVPPVATPGSGIARFQIVPIDTRFLALGPGQIKYLFLV